jgi:DNA processing protein
MMSEREFTLVFNLFEGFGYAKISKIRQFFGNLQVAYSCHNITDWQEAGISSQDILKWLDFKKSMRLKDYLSKLGIYNINYVCYWEESYPIYLKEIYNPPVVLYWKGNYDLLSQKLLGVVGTRKYSGYGKKVTEEMVKGLVDNNIVVVSGLALGIDGIAHASCLANGGLTIGVQAGGLEKFYPNTNSKLGQNIIENGGLMISEGNIEREPNKWQFPARNRIISGLSKGVLITEAPIKSGALITANFALEQNRLVMAVPSDIFNLAGQGCNSLIANGACMVTKIDDILIEMGIKKEVHAEQTINYNFDNELQRQIFDFLANDSKMFDEIVANINSPASLIAAELNIMIMKGYVGEECGGKWYRMA